MPLNHSHTKWWAMLLLLLLNQPVFANSELGLHCLALNIYHEAQFEPIDGQIGVAFVTLNRAREKGMSVCGVVWQKRQFSWTNSAIDENNKLKAKYVPKYDKKWKQIEVLSRSVMEGKFDDPTHGATFYHASYIKKPAWAGAMEFKRQIGKHLFYRNLRFSSSPKNGDTHMAFRF